MRRPERRRPARKPERLPWHHYWIRPFRPNILAAWGLLGYFIWTHPESAKLIESIIDGLLIAIVALINLDRD